MSKDYNKECDKKHSTCGKWWNHYGKIINNQM